MRRSNSLVSFIDGFGYPDNVIIYLRGFNYAICHAQLIDGSMKKQDNCNLPDESSRGLNWLATRM